MRFLLDANLSPRLVTSLAEAGFDTRHVVDVDLLTASDDEIFDAAAENGYVLITADTDFTMLLAARRTPTPSVILLRQVAELRADVHAQLLVDNLASLVTDLEAGAIVSLSPTRIAVRRLPLA